MSGSSLIIVNPNLSTNRFLLYNASFRFLQATGSNTYINRSVYTPLIKMTPSLNKVTTGYTVTLREVLKLLV